MKVDKCRAFDDQKNNTSLWLAEMKYTDKLTYKKVDILSFLSIFDSKIITTFCLDLSYLDFQKEKKSFSNHFSYD